MTTTVPGRLKRIRNCIGENNIAYFARFIFFHAIMCSVKLAVVARIAIIEFSYVVEKYDLHNAGPGQLLGFAMRYLVFNFDIFFFLAVSGLTAMALSLFFVNISSKYLRGLTINLEHKYDSTRGFYERRLEQIGSYLKGKESVTYEEMDKLRSDVGEVELWLKKYQRLFLEQNLVKNFWKLIVK